MRKVHGEFMTVFDVGANTGQFGVQAREWWPEATIISFEPLGDVALQLTATAASDPRWQTYPMGLTDQAGVRQMHRNDTTVCSSLKEMADLHKKTYPFSANSQTEDCVFDVLDGYGELINSPALLKIDTQGSELDVLKGGENVLERFSTVMLEVSWMELYVGTPSFEAINTYLESFGFLHSYRADSMKHPKTGALLQSDEVWERE